MRSWLIEATRHDADSDLRCLAQIWTVEGDSRHWPSPHSLPGFLAQALKESILDHHHVAPSATFAVTIALCVQSIFKGNFLDLARHIPQIHQQAIHLCHPHQRILPGQAREGPLRIERMGLKRLFNGARLSVDSALADFESGTQYCSRHERRKGRVAKKIDSPKHV